MDERIILFSKDGLEINCSDERIINFIVSFEDTNNYLNINDIIELYNVKLYFSSGGLKREKYEDKWEFYKKQISKIWSKICCYFNTLTDENIVKHFCSIEDFIYKEYFWELFAKCKISKRISDDTFKKLFELTNNKDFILKNEEIVNAYDKRLTELLKSNVYTAEYLLSHYERSKQDDRNKLYFPKSLSTLDADEIVSNYIDSEFCNVNYVRLASNSKDYKDFKLSDKTKLKARKKYESEIQKMFKSETSAKIAFTTQVIFSNEQVEPKKLVLEDNSYIYSYSVPWIKNNFTQEQLFLNFRELFGFIDEFGRIEFIPHVSELDLLDIIGLHSDNEYNSNSFSFVLKDNKAILTFVSYRELLAQMGMKLENIVKESFNAFCSDYGIENCIINFTSIDDTLSKIRFLVPELEAVLKKYKSYVEYGAVELELLSISSTPIQINDIPSSVKQKYIYCTEEYKKDLFELFSKQGLLRFNFKEGGRYTNLYEFLLNERADFNAIKDFQKKRFENLILKKYLYVENGFLRFCDSLKMSILNELYANDAISYWFLPDDARKKVDMMVERRELCFQNTLFTKEEADYFNYFLNKKFCNGEDLRNKYVHGTHYPDEQIMENDYNRLLLLFVLILLKIIDDILCYEIMKAENNNE